MEYIIGLVLGVITGTILMYIYKKKIDAQVKRTKNNVKDAMSK